jgi:hypothetical protein
VTGSREHDIAEWIGAQADPVIRRLDAALRSFGWPDYNVPQPGDDTWPGIALDLAAELAAARQDTDRRDRVIEAAKEVDAFVDGKGPGQWRYDGKAITDEAAEPLLSMHDYLNDLAAAADTDTPTPGGLCAQGCGAHVNAPGDICARCPLPEDPADEQTTRLAETRPNVEAPLVVWEYVFAIERQRDDARAEVERLTEALREARPYVNSVAMDYSNHAWRRETAVDVLSRVDAALAGSERETT